jgi:hypothetical protein
VDIEGTIAMSQESAAVSRRRNCKLQRWYRLDVAQRPTDLGRPHNQRPQRDQSRELTASAEAEDTTTVTLDAAPALVTAQVGPFAGPPRCRATGVLTEWSLADSTIDFDPSGSGGNISPSGSIPTSPRADAGATGRLNAPATAGPT